MKIVHYPDFPEEEWSCLLSSLSALTEPSEVTPVTDTGTPQTVRSAVTGRLFGGLKAISVPFSVVSALLSSSPLASRNRRCRNAAVLVLVASHFCARPRGSALELLPTLAAQLLNVIELAEDS